MIVRLSKWFSKLSIRIWLAGFSKLFVKVKQPGDT